MSVVVVIKYSLTIVDDVAIVIIVIGGGGVVVTIAVIIVIIAKEAVVTVSDGGVILISVISAEEWWREGGEFVRRYKNKTGITDIHNRPAPDSPLEKIQKIIVAYHNLVGSYPTPSKNTTTNINNIRRHPAAFNAGPTEITLIKITPPSLTVTTASLAIITIITAMVTTTPPPPPITTMAKYTIMSEYLITTTTGITSYVKNVALITWNIGSELKLIAAQPITAHIFDIIAIPINTITTTITLPPPPRGSHLDYHHD